MVPVVGKRWQIGEVGRVLAGHLEFHAWAAYRASIRVGFNSDLFSLGFAKNRNEPGRGQNGLAWFQDFQPANLQANAQFQVGGHQRASSLLGNRFHIAQDRLHVAGGNGHTGKLKRR